MLIGRKLSGRIAQQQRGSVLLEAMIAILIFSMGILAIVGLQAASLKAVSESKYRVDASFLANQVVSDMWVDRNNLASYVWDGSGTAPGANYYLGRAGAKYPARR